jgi:N6-adenosine-specific RNA methylase IME4
MRYDVLYADPPWAYRNLRTGGSHTSGSAQKYRTIPTHHLHTLPIRDVMAPNSVAFLWATVPFGKDPYEVLASWGYRFVTEWAWHKVGRKGTGYWTRGSFEKVLVGVRGTVPAWRSSLDNWFESKPGPHSRKPASVRTRIEVLTPGMGKRVELFATERVPGWDSYGLALDPSHDVCNPTFWATLKDL